MRSNNNFDYNIGIADAIDQSATYIPNMIIQPFIENSIHHGMMNTKDSKGMMKISISKSNKLICIVDDNGPGIKSTGTTGRTGNESHTPMGGAITEKRIAMYNSIHEDKIELQVSDKTNTGNNESGTRVILKFPLIN